MTIVKVQVDGVANIVPADIRDRIPATRHIKIIVRVPENTAGSVSNEVKMVLARTHG
jgi:hypothetical protein